MAALCCREEPQFDGVSERYKRVLLIVIAINIAMFVVEMTAGVTGGSQALQADALDFLGDSATYAISLYVIGGTLQLRAKAALFKGLSLGGMGLWVLGSTIYQVFFIGMPEAIVMGTVGVLALIANVVSAALLFKFRNGDANVRSVWLCSRNDAIGNIAVIVAATGVWMSGTGWPDLVVAGIMASLFLSGAVQIIKQARYELLGTTLTEATAET